MIQILRADPASPEIQPIIEAHLAHSWDAAPQTSNHTMGAEDLKDPAIRFWALYDGETPLGCGALKTLPDGTAEVKSVHVLETARGRGLARKMMDFLAEQARFDGISALVLETGSDLLPEYLAARKLYEALGYDYVGPIYGYDPDPNSAFMRLGLDPAR
ncbi:MAG: GNAT family N-acetyltransferase [Rhodobacteraceae bacterium]|nr:GNAT family N-acetyltransferase [Paracoccaceae bacterium]